jgi:salicylate hydroxylase
MALAGHKIAVIGAGIGGLAAAAALAQRRAEVTLFEAAAALGEVGGGLQVAPNGVAVLEALGLRDAVERVASLPEAVELCDFRDGRTVTRLPLGPACVGRYGRPYWHVHRADLAFSLAEAAREAGVRLVLGARVVEVSGTAEGQDLRVVTDGGAAVPAEIVVAADGLRSAVRAAWFKGSPPRFTGHVAWRALIEAERLPAELVPAAARVTMGPGRHIVTYPLRGGRQVNVVAVEERAEWTAEGWSTRDDPEDLRRAFEGWGGGVPALLAAVDETYLWGLFDHAPLPVWTKGRIALLGDACHPMLPYLAQGATMALEDAWVLAAELDVAPTPEQGLMAYEARRAPRAARVQRATARNGRLYHLRPGPRALANLGLRAVGALAPGGLIGRFDWLYGADVVSARATG